MNNRAYSRSSSTPTFPLKGARIYDFQKVHTSAAAATNLLVKAGLLQKEEATMVSEISQTTGHSQAQVLVRSGFLTQQQYMNVERAQELMQQDVVSENLAMEALRFANPRGMSLDKGLKYMGWGW